MAFNIDERLDEIYSVQGDGNYADVLAVVQSEMSKLTEFNVDNMSSDDIHNYKLQIQNIISVNRLKCRDATTLSDLVDRLYDSMVNYDVLTHYLDAKVFLDYGIEEIYGRWDAIRLLCKDGKVLLPYKFPSREVAETIFARIAQRFNGNLNSGTPLALGEFMPNIRASFSTSPVTPETQGSEFNIRIVHGSKMTRELLIGNGTIDEQSLDFLELCIKHKIGICISGSTGSGKTGTMYYLLSQVTQDATYRVGTIEIESREFDLIRYDDSGNSINDVFSWVTRSSDDDRQNVTANALLQAILRFKPDIIGVGEMRNDEAAIAVEAGSTGHGLITTTHCDSAEDTPMRLFTLCKKAGGKEDERTVFSRIAQAFPIIVHQRLELDGKTRRIYEIAEFLGYHEGAPKVHNLFQFMVADNNIETRTSIGAYRRVGNISERLRQKLLRNGAPLSEIEKYIERRNRC